MDRMNLFKKYISKRYSEKTVNNYVGGIRSISSELLSRELIDRDIYTIDDAEVVNDLLKTYLNVPELKEKNSNGHNMYSASIKKYVEFYNETLKKGTLNYDKDIIDIKDRFIKYIGSTEKLEKNLYKRSFKIVWMMSLLKILSNPDMSSLITQSYSIYKSIFEKLDLKKEFSMKEGDVFSENVLRRKFREAPLIALTDTEFFEYNRTDDRIMINDSLMKAFTTNNINEINDLLEIKLNQYIELRKIDDMDNVDENVMVMGNNEFIEYLKLHLEGQGLIYSDELLKTIYLSMRSKPLVLLAGISGTGKSRFVKGLAEACGANTGNGRYRMISVRPDWSDSSDLLGFCDFNGTFNPGPLTEFVYEACRDNKPYFLCLDEMNLARVEHYFSDILSVVETRKKVGGRIITDKLLNREMFGRDEDAMSKYSELILPDNLFFFGTVNMDESTYPFSNKVLDRANTIEFNHIDFSINNFSNDEIEDRLISNEMFVSKYISIRDCLDDIETVDKINDLLTNINKILEDTNYKFGYRIRDEICYFITYALETELMDFDDAFDFGIYQKILPKIKGSQLNTKEVIKNLFKNFVGNETVNFEDRTKKYYEKMNDEINNNENIKYPRSAEKLVGLMRSFEVDGYASFWN
jgi:MoxR-like ATPase